MEKELIGNRGNPDYRIPFPLIAQKYFDQTVGIDAKTRGRTEHEGKAGDGNPSRPGNQGRCATRKEIVN